MLCLSGKEKSNAELLERLNKPFECAVPLLYEVRADFLSETPDFDRIFASGRDLIFTCRCADEGGLFRGDDDERFRLFEKALTYKPWAIDIEFESEPHKRDALVGKAKELGVKVILSRHSSAVCSDLDSEIKHLRSLDADYWKFVAPIDDSTKLFDWLEIENDGRLILIASGAAGQLSRYCFRRFGSPFTYVSSNVENASADYQPTILDLANSRLSVRDDSDIFLIMGGKQIVNSRGPHVFNRLFGKLNFNAVYSLAISDDAAGLLKLADRLKIKGASVTKPLKESILPLLGVIDERGGVVGAINTLRRDCDVWHATNTDVVGFEKSLESLYSEKKMAGSKALLLGAGGAARALAYVLTKSGFCVAVCNRSIERASKLAAEFDMDVWPWEKRHLAEFDLLVNSTSVGMDDPENTPYPYPEKLKDRLLVDIISHPAESRLVLEARRAGVSVAIGGMTMWLYQAAAQLDFWLGWKTDVSELEELI